MPHLTKIKYTYILYPLRIDDKRVLPHKPPCKYLHLNLFRFRISYSPKHSLGNIYLVMQSMFHKFCDFMNLIMKTYFRLLKYWILVIISNCIYLNKLYFYFHYFKHKVSFYNRPFLFCCAINVCYMFILVFKQWLCYNLLLEFM